jgi:excinuclease UvrABC nuclease subunit
MDLDYFVYRAFDSEGRVLYIGQTCNLGRRISDHVCSSWWCDAASITWEHFDSREDALEAERAAIRAERPPHNVVHNPDFTARLEAALRAEVAS